MPPSASPINIIPESDVYRLVMRSKLPTAEAFQDWVVEEALPYLRLNGGYWKRRVSAPFSPGNAKDSLWVGQGCLGGVERLLA